MTTTAERQAQPVRTLVLRADPQDDQWRVKVKEDSLHPTSYVLYVNSECLFPT
jgi:hypothetical protein